MEATSVAQWMMSYWVPWKDPLLLFFYFIVFFLFLYIFFLFSPFFSFTPSIPFYYYFDNLFWLGSYHQEWITHDATVYGLMESVLITSKNDRITEYLRSMNWLLSEEMQVDFVFLHTSQYLYDEYPKQMHIGFHYWHKVLKELKTKLIIISLNFLQRSMGIEHLIKAAGFFFWRL